MTAEARSGDILNNVSYVLASRQREKVLASVIPGPKTPVQVSQLTGLRLPHVSRTLTQLSSASLVQVVAGARKGRLYGPTSLGQAVFGELADARGDRLIAPMVRGGHLRNYHHWLTLNYGAEAAEAVFVEVGMSSVRLDPDGWYPLRTALEMLDRIEVRFGDGTYDTIRRLLRDEIGNFRSVRRIIARVLPIQLIIELSPNAYAREFNHGRLEVDVQDHRAILRNYDWISSPARCAAWQGTYEGTLRLLGKEGRVAKVACMLKGDPYCGYSLEW